jgi:ribosomal protein S18 acetylase RimI-like enzyme
MIRLRVPSKDDLHLYRLIVKSLLPLARKAQPELSLGKKKTLLRIAKSKVFVSARQGKPPFGFISLKIKNRILFIDMLAVEASNANRGWGSLLMDAAERYGKMKGCPLAQLFVDRMNEHAIAFYINKGYEIQEYVPLVHCYRMQKYL